MQSLAAWSLRFRLLVLGLAAGVMLAGATLLPNMSVTTVPEFTPPYVEIQTEALGLSAEEVEQLITVPLEADLLHGVAWLQEIRSNSVAGLSSILLLFERGTNVFRARQMVAERLTQAHFLPNVSKAPTMLQPLASTSRVQMIGLRSTGLSPIEMSVLARWTIRPRLMGVPGVANVAIWGQRERQLQVQVDPRRLNANDVTLEDIVETTGNALWFSPLTFLDASTPGTGGFIDTPNQRLTVQHILPIDSPEDLAAVTIADTIEEGRPGLRLGDVADVVEDHQPLIGDAVIGGGPGLLLLVERFPDADVREVTRGVEAALDAMAPGLTGMAFETSVYRPATYIDAAFTNISLGLLIGMLLVAAALFAFLLELRTPVVVLATMAVSLTAAALVLYVTGQTMNIIVISGLLLAVGVLVDDAIVGVENIAARLRTPRPGDADRRTAAIILEGALRGRGAIVFATAILLVAIIPLLFVTGAAGTFLPLLAAAYALAIVTSMVVALTLGPALASLLLKPSAKESRTPPIAGRLAAAYARALQPFVGRVSLATAGVLLTVGTIGAVALGVIASRGGAPFMPDLREGDVVIRWDAEAGASHPRMNEELTTATKELMAVEGVRSASAHFGRAVLADRVVGINAGEIWVSIDSSADYERTLDRIRTIADEHPGLADGVVTYPSARVNEVLSAPTPDAYVRVYGQEAAVLEQHASAVKERLSGIAGVESATVETQRLEDTIEIEVDLAAAEAVGLKPGEVRRAAAALLSGIEVGALFEDQKVFEVVVWGTPEIRSSAADVSELLIDTPSGDVVPLGQVADVRVVQSPSAIAREGVMRKLDVFVYLDGRDTAATLRDIDAAVEGVDFTLQYHAEVFSPLAEREAADLTLALVTLAAIAGILLLLQAALNSWRLAGLFLLTLPVALIGGLLVAVFTGGLTIAVVGGLLTVLAITARNAIASVDHYRHVEAADEEADEEVVVQAARERLAPIVLTAVSTAAAVIPFVFLRSAPGSEILGPMAAVILGALVTSTLANLFLVPILAVEAGPEAPEIVSTFDRPPLPAA